MKKVLIISYYWPPAGGSAVQRWVQMSAYFADYGWSPVVYTPENAEYPLIDAAMEKKVDPRVKVIRNKIWEPYSFYKRFTGMKKEERLAAGLLTEKKIGWKQKFSRWVRGNFFVPDARVSWVKPSVRFLSEWLKENPVDAIISTGPPHSMHLIAMQLGQRLNIPWVADFRDPWTTMDYYSEMYIMGPADRKHRRMERAVVTGASRVVVVGKYMKKEFEDMYGRNVEVIPNGFDKISTSSETDKEFTLVHVGSLLKNRNPITFWSVIAELCKTRPDFAAKVKIRLVGKVDNAAMVSIQANGLEKYVEHVSFVTHAEALRYQEQAQVLLLLLDDIPNAGFVLSGKFFEYLAAKRPILCIGPPDGDAAHVLAETNAGTVVPFRDAAATREAILRYFDAYQNGTLQVHSSGIEKYSRKVLAGTYCSLLDTITSSRNA